VASRTSPHRLDDLPRIIESVRDEVISRFSLVSAELVRDIMQADPVYADLVPPVELRRRVQSNLRQALNAVVGYAQGKPLDLSDAAATGCLRAEQGLPLPSLMRAYRRGGRLLWECIIQAVAERDPALLPALLPGASDVWDVLDQISRAVSDSYRQADSTRADRDRDRRHALLDALLDGSGTATGLLSEAVTRLDLPERGAYAVIALHPTSGQGELPSPASPFQLVWRARADRELGLLALRDRPLGEAVALLAPYRLRAGISPVVGSLTELGRARWLAELALQTCVGPGPETALFDERLPAALIAAQSDVARRLRTVVLGRVLERAPAECEVLLATLGAWLATGGSTTLAARQLYCHRNTVSNRLRRLEQLTGRSLTVPADVVELSLALEAIRQCETRVQPARITYRPSLEASA
jgi:hypothetical protein